MKTLIKLSIAILVLGSVLTLTGCGHWGCWGGHDHRGHGHHCCCLPAEQ